MPSYALGFAQQKRVGNDVFEIYKALYGYQTTDLDATVESVDESSDLWRREKIRFKAAYGNEQVIAYLFLPANSRPPYQCVVFFPSDVPLRPGSGEALQPQSYVLRSGRAMLYPIYKGMLERYVPVTVRDPISIRDATVSWRKDLGRSIDYLQTRRDIDSSKLAYMGSSLGSEAGPIFLATEARLRIAVLLSGGLSEYFGALPEVNAVNFLPRVKIPVLMVNGKYDSILPVEQSQESMFQLLGTPASNKRHVLLASGHAVAGPEVRNDVIREVLNWLDQYLGAVRAQR
jgi:pimeloyl-ACP methyl ester carboxylesterase